MVFVYALSYPVRLTIFGTATVVSVNASKILTAQPCKLPSEILLTTPYGIKSPAIVFVYHKLANLALLGMFKHANVSASLVNAQKLESTSTLIHAVVNANQLCVQMEVISELNCVLVSALYKLVQKVIIGILTLANAYVHLLNALIANFLTPQIANVYTKNKLTCVYKMKCGTFLLEHAYVIQTLYNAIKILFLI